MLYLTDHPENTRPLLPPGETWRPGAAGGLAAADGQAWRVLGSGGRVWHARPGSTADPADPANPAKAEARIVLIDHAPESQFDAVVHALKAGVELPDRLLCLALAGSGFRGQRDRRWSALRGNLHLTAHYRIDVDAAEAEAGLTALPAVAAVRAVIGASQGRLAPTIKWVNDILIDGRKVAGVLTATQVQGRRMTNVVFGVGMNVAEPPRLAPSPQGQPAAALGAFEPALADDLPAVFHAVRRELDAGIGRLLHEGSAPLYHAYLSLAGFLGRQVRIWPEQADGAGAAKPLAAGRVRALGRDLSLRLEGCARPIRKGRMQLVDEPTEPPHG